MRHNSKTYRGLDLGKLKRKTGSAQGSEEFVDLEPLVPPGSDSYIRAPH
jgi:hypothetical protein